MIHQFPYPKFEGPCPACAEVQEYNKTYLTEKYELLRKYHHTGNKKT